MSRDVRVRAPRWYAKAGPRRDSHRIATRARRAERAVKASAVRSAAC